MIFFKYLNQHAHSIVPCFPFMFAVSLIYKLKIIRKNIHFKKLLFSLSINYYKINQNIK
jgi:hypothetical protein